MTAQIAQFEKHYEHKTHKNTVAYEMFARWCRRQRLRTITDRSNVCIIWHTKTSWRAKNKYHWIYFISYV